MFGRCNNADIYERLYPLGEGTYGKVFKARHRETSELVALKKIIVGSKSDVFPETFLREIRALLSIQHPNIVRLKEIVLEAGPPRIPVAVGASKKRPADDVQELQSDRPVKAHITDDGEWKARYDDTAKSTVPVTAGVRDEEEDESPSRAPRSSFARAASPVATYLVFEYCSIDLFALQQERGPAWQMPRSEVKCIMQQLLRGLDCLHQNFIIHRDIKLPNLFLTSKGELKIGDLGLAREFEHPASILTPDLVTLWYRAPELFFGLREYASAVDIWAAGCVMGELLLGVALLPGASDADQVWGALLTKNITSDDPYL